MHDVAAEDLAERAGEAVVYPRDVAGQLVGLAPVVVAVNMGVLGNEVGGGVALSDGAGVVARPRGRYESSLRTCGSTWVPRSSIALR